MQFVVLSIAMVLLLAILFKLRLAKSASQDDGRWERRTSLGASHPFHAVSVGPVPGSCTVALSVRSLRFLSDEAPSLPLENCTAAQCKCRYMHYPDRRSGTRDRRLGPVEESDESEFWGLRNRRSFLGRRLSEKQPALK
ncbi:MAG: hypothetical protein IPG64_04495 [Haliea sp.]|jgi:hypothetical protein|nr:hypothetical protein [Haliea sp.]MBK6737205.1 hypothetical protein [Haliea sp.]